MIHTKFKNLEKSEMAREAVHERIEALIEKFPDLNESKTQITLEMENSPSQAGSDLFKVKLHVARGRFDESLQELLFINATFKQKSYRTNIGGKNEMSNLSRGYVGYG